MLVATTVGGALLLSIGGDEHLASTADAEVTADALVITHTGGESVRTSELVVLANNGTDSITLELDSAAIEGDGDELFDPGERWVRSWDDLGLSVEAGDSVKVRLLHRPTGEALYDGRKTVPDTTAAIRPGR